MGRKGKGIRENLISIKIDKRLYEMLREMGFKLSAEYLSPFSINKTIAFLLAKEGYDVKRFGYEFGGN